MGRFPWYKKYPTQRIPKNLDMQQNYQFKLRISLIDSNSKFGPNTANWIVLQLCRHYFHDPKLSKIWLLSLKKLQACRLYWNVRYVNFNMWKWKPNFSQFFINKVTTNEVIFFTIHCFSFSNYRKYEGWIWNFILCKSDISFTLYP